MSDIVLGHQDYTLVVGKILKRARHGEPLLSDARISSGTDGNAIAEDEKRQMAQLRKLVETT